MAITVSELIKELQTIQAEHDGDLVVVTDSEEAVEAVEYNDTDGAPAAIIVLGG